MINHRNKQNYRFRTWKFRDRCHLKGGVRQGCFLSLILNNLIQYIHFHCLYITSHYYAKFKENPCVGTDARPPLRNRITLHNQHIRHAELRKIPVSGHIADCSDQDPKYFVFPFYLMKTESIMKRKEKEKYFIRTFLPKLNSLY